MNGSELAMAMGGYGLDNVSDSDWTRFFNISNPNLAQIQNIRVRSIIFFFLNKNLNHISRKIDLSPTQYLSRILMIFFFNFYSFGLLIKNLI